MKNLLVNEKQNVSELSTEKIPILFQEESYSIAWGTKHQGDLINPIGNWYSYSQPQKWNFCSSDDNNSLYIRPYPSISNCYGYISPEELFENISQSRIVAAGGLSWIKDIQQLKYDLERIINSSKKEVQCGNLQDGPYIAQNVYMYREEHGKYERFTLRHTGNLIVNHSSKEVDGLLDSLGFTLRI